MKVQIWDRHRDRVGGGTMPIIALHNALVRLGHDVWTVDGFHPDIDLFEFIDWPYEPQVGRIEEPDLFIYNSYWELVEPWGKENWLYCLYPRQLWNTQKYQRILTLSKYSQDAIFHLWGRKAEILIGSAFSENWYPGGKKLDAILSCSRFFIEGDVETGVGHSKNQHHLIKVFKMMSLPYYWQLWLAGSVLTPQDAEYLEMCRWLAKDDPRIIFFPMVGKIPLRILYQKARIFWHAMGYGRADPAEVEHYGIVTLKAKLCGLWTVTHRSGNQDLSDEVFDNLNGLVAATEKLIKAPSPRPMIRTREDFLEEVRRLL